MKMEKQIIEEYLKYHSINPIGYLAKDLEEGNWKALRFPAYAITNLHHLNVLPDLFKTLASIKIPQCNQKKINESKSRYYNLITEFFGAWFVAYTLGLNIKQIESSPTVKIISPYCSTAKSCDILADHQSGEVYFEVKDLSSEVLSERPYYDDPSLTFLTPRLPSEKRNWISRKINEAIKKGANYLICRIPVWSSPDKPGLGIKWLSQIFPTEERIGQREFKVRFKRSLPDYFKGVYLIKNTGHLLIRP